MVSAVRTKHGREVKNMTVDEMHDIMLSIKDGNYYDMNDTVLHATVLYTLTTDDMFAYNPILRNCKDHNNKVLKLLEDYGFNIDPDSHGTNYSYKTSLLVSEDRNDVVKMYFQGDRIIAITTSKKVTTQINRYVLSIEEDAYGDRLELSYYYN